MDIQTAKQIRIADYLHSLGYSPVKQQGVNLWYKSPLREEAEASFKVNTEREQWYDFGLGKGGGIIELAAHLYATDHVPYILKRIAEQTPHVRPVSFSFGKQNSSEPSFQQLEIVPLSSTALLAYLQGRGINIKLAKENVVKHVSLTTASGTLPSPFPMVRVDMKSATAISRAASPQRKSPTSGSREKRGIPVMCSRDLWTTSPFDIETRELPKLSGIGRAGLHCIELRIECKQGSLSVGQLRTHPLLFRQRPCRTGSTPANPHGIRQRAVHPGRFADLQRMQGLERILTETD